jgi:pimeloyl-ACP methyl ester carboxylesterase
MRAADSRGHDTTGAWEDTSDRAVRVNDIDMYFERRGEGQPLLLLHGGGGAGVNWRLIFDSSPGDYPEWGICPDLR